MYFQVSNNCQQRWDRLYTAATSASSCLEYCSEPLTHGNLERSTQHSQKLVAKQAKSVNSQTTNQATGAGGFIKSAMIISVKKKLTIVTKRGNQMLPAKLSTTIYKEEKIKKNIVVTTIALFVGELRVSSTAPLTTSAKYTTWRTAEKIRTPAAIRRHSDLVSCMKINMCKDTVQSLDQKLLVKNTQKDKSSKEDSTFC